ncbi:hypothetical protein B296_00006475, partial [Ensete ventricosum]
NSTVPESNGAGDGDPMTVTVAAGSTECSTAGVQPKTDTASVLHEAALSINFLHEQIKVRSSNLFSVFVLNESDAYKTYNCQGHARNIADLRSRGLCLAAVDAIPELMDGKACSTCWPEIPVREAGLDRHRLSNFTTMHTP